VCDREIEGGRDSRRDEGKVRNRGKERQIG
jgi:hypothetical protein